MRKGRAQKVNWSAMEAPKFDIHTKDDTQCGAWALHAISKIPYHKIVPLGKNGHWPTRTMLKFLKDLKCEVTPVTLGNVVESQSVKTGKKLISDNSVILIEQGCFKEESTWAVLHNGKISHSGEVSDIEPMEFVNWPILQAYLITHKMWKYNSRYEE